MLGIGDKDQIYISYYITTSQLDRWTGASVQRVGLGPLLRLVRPHHMLYLQGHIPYCKAILKGPTSLPSQSVVQGWHGMGRKHPVLVQSAASICCEQWIFFHPP